MTPDEHGVCREVVGYLVTFAVLVSKVELLSFVAMSNHWHGGDIDVEAKHGKFLSTLNGLLARVFNAKLGRGGHFWDARKPSVQKIVDLEAHIEQFVYIALNPVRAGLVPTAAAWPGFIITPDMIGKTLTFRRPDLPFFRSTRRGRRMPEEIKLTIAEPPGAEAAYGPGGYAREVARRLAEAERKIQLERSGSAHEGADRVAGTMRGLVGASAREPASPEAFATRPPTTPVRGFLGRDKIFQTDPLSPTPAPESRGPLREIICYDPARRSLELTALQDFRIAYRRAQTALSNGKRRVVFPAGTYALRLHYGVKTAPPPVDDERVERALALHAQMSATT